MQRRSRTSFLIGRDEIEMSLGSEQIDHQHNYPDEGAGGFCSPVPSGKVARTKEGEKSGSWGALPNAVERKKAEEPRLM